MVITPIRADAAELGLGVSGGSRSTGVHASDLYGSLYKALEPKRYDSGEPMDPLRLDMGLNFESILEEGLKKRLNGGERPDEFITEEGIAFSPDLIIFNGCTRVGEIKLTFMSCREMPTERATSLPPKFSKWETQIKFYCVGPSTKILTRRLEWVAADTLKQGDELLAFDEYPTSENGRRKWKPAVVTRAALITRPCYRLVLDDGTELTCSDDHMWLVRYGARKSMSWVKTSQLYEQDYRIVKPVDVWEPERSYDAGYISGIYDGEGCLFQRRDGHVRALMLDVAQLPGLVMDRLKGLLLPMGFRYRAGTNDRKSPVARIECRNFRKIITFLGKYRPLRLLAKFATLDEFPATGFSRDCRVVSCVRIGEHPVIAIETTAHTFIAEGFASHNCRALETPYARLYGFFVCGDYDRSKGFGPQLRGWDIEYSRRELDENHSMLINHGKHVGLLGPDGRAVQR